MKSDIKIGDLIHLSDTSDSIVKWINIWHKDRNGNFVPEAVNDQRYFLVTGFCAIKQSEQYPEIIYVEIFCLNLQERRWIREWDIEGMKIVKNEY